MIHELTRSSAAIGVLLSERNLHLGDSLVDMGQGLRSLVPRWAATRHRRRERRLRCRLVHIGDAVGVAVAFLESGQVAVGTVPATEDGSMLPVLR